MEPSIARILAAAALAGAALRTPGGLGPEPAPPNETDLAEARRILSVVGPTGIPISVEPRHLIAYEQGLMCAAYEAALFWSLATSCLAAIADLGIDVNAIALPKEPR